MLVIIIAGGALYIQSFVRVPAGYRGVLLTGGKPEDRVLGEGLNFIILFVQSGELMNVQIQKVEFTESAATKRPSGSFYHRRCELQAQPQRGQRDLPGAQKRLCLKGRQAQHRGVLKGCHRPVRRRGAHHQTFHGEGHFRRHARTHA